MKPAILLILILFTLLPSVCLAQADCYPGNALCNPAPNLQGKSVSTIVGTIIKAVLGITGSIALVLFIIAGFIWMTAQGNAQKIQTSQKIMAWAAIGLAVIFSSYALLTFVFNII